MVQDETWHGGGPWSKPHCPRWGLSFPPQKGGGAPFRIFGPFLLRPNGWMHQGATWYGGKPQPRGLCVRWGASPSQKRMRSPQFSAHVYCVQTAARINMPLGTEVGLGPDDNVLDGDPALPLRKKGAEPLPNFRPMSIVAKRLYGSRRHLARRWALVQATLC